MVTADLQVMVRRGGREERSREVQVPVSSAVAAALAERAAAEAAERAHIKRLTLQVGDLLSRGLRVQGHQAPHPAVRASNERKLSESRFPASAMPVTIARQGAPFRA